MRPAAYDHPLYRYGVLSALLLLALLLLWTFRDINQRGDSLMYLAVLAGGEHLFHPHHLLHMPILALLGRLLPGWSMEAVSFAHNAAALLVGLSCTYLWVSRLYRSPWAGGLAGLALLLAIDSIRYTVYVEVYLAAMACAACLLVLCAGDAWPGRGQRVLLTGLLALGVFYHQTQVLFVLPFAAYGWQRWGRRGLLLWAQVVVPAGAVVLGAYLLAAWQAGEPLTWAGMRHFVFSYAYAPYAHWGTARNLSAMGLVELFNSQTDVFIYKGSDIFSLATLFTLGWNMWQLIRRRDPLRLLLLGYVLCHYLFLWWWLPGEEEFLIAPGLALLWLFFLMLHDVLAGRWSPRVRVWWLAGGLAALLAVAVVSNGPWLWQERTQPSQDRQRAAAMLRLGGTGCGMVSLGSDHFWLLHRGGAARVVNVYDLQAAFYNQSMAVPVRDSCMLVPVEALDPAYKGIPVDAVGMAGEWQALLDWLLAAGGGRVQQARWETEGGQEYLLVGGPVVTTALPVPQWLDSLRVARGLPPRLADWAAGLP